MRILVLSNEVWSDSIHGNNVITSWFEGTDAEFANMYASAGDPDNTCCHRYFQVTDMMMLKSVFGRKKAGREFKTGCIELQKTSSIAEKEPEKLYSFFKVITGSFLRFARELLWLFGQYNLDALEKFVTDFQPDVVFSERMATCKMLRLERQVMTICDAPFFAFTGDDEYSLNQLAISPFFWINRLMVRRMLRENIQKYEVYYTLSSEQAEYYEETLGANCKLLYKCGDLNEIRTINEQHSPIRMVYAGKLYCNRWKMLSDIVSALDAVNVDGTKVVLDIYTKDKVTRHQRRQIDNGSTCRIRGSLTKEELLEVYNDSDIALHVESTDLRNRLATRFSFSTKIVDCLFSGCAVLAYCWEGHAGYKYLSKERAAICVSDREGMKKALLRIAENPSLLIEYANRASNCAKRNHEQSKVKNTLFNDFFNSKK